LEISDGQLRAAYNNFIHSRTWGVASSFCSCFACDGIGAPWRYHTDTTVKHFLTCLLDAVYFEVNGFGDEWSIRIPGLSDRDIYCSDFGPAFHGGCWAPSLSCCKGMAAGSALLAARMEHCRSAAAWRLDVSDRPPSSVRRGSFWGTYPAEDATAVAEVWGDAHPQAREGRTVWGTYAVHSPRGRRAASANAAAAAVDAAVKASVRARTPRGRCQRSPRAQALVAAPDHGRRTPKAPPGPPPKQPWRPTRIWGGQLEAQPEGQRVL
jgi:hypothetical protein